MFRPGYFFGASRIRIRKYLYGYGFSDPYPSINKQKIKINHELYSFVTSQYLLPLKIYVNLPKVRKKQIMQCTDPRIRIRNKMSEIRNTGANL
jgi:hypothetical protein